MEVESLVGLSLKTTIPGEKITSNKISCKGGKRVFGEEKPTARRRLGSSSEEEPDGNPEDEIKLAGSSVNQKKGKILYRPGSRKRSSIVPEPPPPLAALALATATSE